MDRVSEIIAGAGVVPVIRLDNPYENATHLAKALCAGGLPLAEVTFRAEGAPEGIRLMKAARPDMLVGAGTVTSTEQIAHALIAGAEFIVCPGFDPELVEYCQARGVPVFPGCTTASEYHMALKHKLSIIKFFPAEQSGGLAKIKALAAPFPQLAVMPTGGISLNNLEEYLGCGTIIACGASFVCEAGLINSKSWDEITRRCQQASEIVRRVRKS